MSDACEFEAFQKIARFNRDIIITEKIDGTNAQIFIGEDGCVRAGSRNRWVTPENDNYGFAAWVYENADSLRNLGTGRHYGEWWGRGINRGYSIIDRRFSLFNVGRWAAEHPGCCDIVPVLYAGQFRYNEIIKALKTLKENGSVASPGYMDPEGIIIWHTAARKLFKITLKNDDAPKSVVKSRDKAG